MTIEKIKVQHPTSYNMALIEEKLNTIIDVVNSLTGGEKEKCSDPRGNELCTDGINTYHQFNTTEPGYKCPYCNQKAPKKPEPKSNTLREEAGEEIREQMHKILHRIYADTYNQHKDIETLLSLVKESLIEKFEEEDYSTYSMAQVKQIIKNL